MAHPKTADRPPPSTNGQTSPPPPPPPQPTGKSSTAAAAAAAKVGPHPGHIKSPNQYTPEDRIRRLLADNGSDPAREDSNRLQGVQLIDAVRQRLQLPVRTYDTACVYFHHFRLSFRDAEYNYQDAALASLFVACKVEDTIKKSKEILAAAYNVKNPDKPVAPDDKIFESPGKVIIGLERLILETIGFDFRTRYPQKLLVKVIRRVTARDHDAPGGDGSGADLFATAYAMSIDMYKTFVPIKRTTFSMAMALAELSARLLRRPVSTLEALSALADQKGPRHHSRPAVMETMLDLLDLYVQHPKSTKLGTRFDPALLMDVKIQLNQDLERSSLPRHATPRCPRCESSSSSPSSPPPSPPPRGQQDSTMRFVFDPETASREEATVRGYFRQEYEEYEVEVDEPVPPPPPTATTTPRHHGGAGPPSRRDDRDGDARGGHSGPGPGRGGRGGGNRRYRDRPDHRWDGPYGGGGGGGGYRGDRHRDRGRGRHR